MRRSARFGLIVAILLIAGFAAYSAYWWVAAGRLAQGVAAWAEAARAQKLFVPWQKLRIAGYPLAFRVELSGVHLHDDAVAAAPDLVAAHLSGSTRPWDFRDWQVTAPDGMTAGLGPQGAPLAHLAARAASGAVALGDKGGAAIWLTLNDVAGASALPGTGIGARTARFWVILPDAAPRTHLDRNVAFAADLRGLAVPQPVPGFGNSIDDLAFGLTVMGAIPAGTPPKAAAAWRDAGGTVELDHLHLRWRTLDIDASGTLALDRNLQPIGGFSGRATGYDSLVTALVASGRVDPADATIARLALAVLARPGPDGKPQIKTSFTIQGGQMFLGPARLGKVPRIPW